MHSHVDQVFPSLTWNVKFFGFQKKAESSRQEPNIDCLAHLAQIFNVVVRLILQKFSSETFVSILTKIYQNHQLWFSSLNKCVRLNCLPTKMARLEIEHNGKNHVLSVSLSGHKCSKCLYHSRQNCQATFYRIYWPNMIS